MSLASGAHVSIGGVEYKLDEGYEAIVGRRPYSHAGRSIFAERFDITGQPGRNLRQERLIWYSTNFAGEGQVVLDPSDPDSAAQFYRSEGLDFRTAGQAKLNKSTLVQNITVSAGATTTDQGNTFTDITGTSTDSGTDTRLNTINDKVEGPTNFAPGATNSVATFYLYRESFSDYATTIQGSAFIEEIGPTSTTGTDIKLQPGSAARSANLTVTAGNTTRVEFFLYGDSSPAEHAFRIQVYDKDTGDVVATRTLTVTDTSSPSSANGVLSFVPKTGKTYRARATFIGLRLSQTVSAGVGYLDKILYGNEVTENTAVIEVYNSTGAASVDTKTVTIGATAAGTAVGSISWSAAGATNYRPRVKWASGKQRIYVDKTELVATANALYTMDCLDFGSGGKMWMGAHATSAAVDSQGFVYNTSTNAWDTTVTFADGADTTHNFVVRAMDHSDSAEYFLLSDGTNNKVYTGTAAGVDDLYANFSANERALVGMTICQNRLILMAEDTSGVRIYSVPLDSKTVDPWVLNTPSTGVNILDIPAGSKTPDTTLRNRMASSPTGARFFVNYDQGTAKVFQVDTSGTQMQYNELADLGHGVIATSIAYEGGITFIGGLYYGIAGAASADVDKLARPAMWVIDQNGVLQRVGFFRRDNPAAGAVVAMEPFQTDLYMLQSGIDKDGINRGYVWRYSLVTGGLFLEYELTPTTTANQRDLAVIPGRTFALYTGEVFATGTVTGYRQATVSGGNSITTSISDFDLPSVTKNLVKVDVLTDTMPSNTEVRAEYQIDQSGTWVLLGTATSGKRNTFVVDQVTFTTLQLRTTLVTKDGVSTPVYYATIAEARAAEDEEYFDLVLLCEDADAGFGIDGDSYAGNDKAQNLISLWRSGVPTTFVDGYTTKGTAGDTYLVTVGDFRDERTAVGEGRVVVTLKVVR